MQLRPPQTLHRVGVEKGIAEAARLCFQLLQHRAGGLVELRREEIGFPVTVAGLVAMSLCRAASNRCSADEHKLVRAEIVHALLGSHYLTLISFIADFAGRKPWIRRTAAESSLACRRSWNARSGRCRCCRSPRGRWNCTGFRRLLRQSLPRRGRRRRQRRRRSRRWVKIGKLGRRLIQASPLPH